MIDPALLDARLPRAAGRTVFGTDIEGYHAGRPGYPAALYDHLRENLALAPAIAEIGPGTGLATAVLAEFGPSRFVAFEPDGLLAAHLRTRFQTLEVIEDDFAAATLADGFDLIAAASSFHWLDPATALAQARRLLRPGGRVAIWWNVYRQPDIGDAFADAVLPLIADLDLPPSEGADGHYALDLELHRARLHDAGFERIDYRLFRRERTLMPADARALYSTFSMVRLLPAPRREALLDAIAALVVDRFAGAAPSMLLTPLYLAVAPGP